ncbi:MAG: hypothetical protein AB7J35_13720 [Dehalococcoidia bacterium]
MGLLDEEYAKALALALDQWEQGDVVELDRAAYLADLGDSLLSPSTEAHGLGTVFVELDMGLALVVTQTCDIVDSNLAAKPLALLAPLCTLDKGSAGNASRGRMPRYLPVPWIADDVFADLALIFAVEKPLLAKSRKRAGPPSDQARRVLAKNLARWLGRAAFPDEFHPATTRLRQRFRSSAPVEDLVFEIRAIAIGDDWWAPEIDVHFYFIAWSEEQFALRSRAEWDAALEDWLTLCSPEGRIRRITGEYLSLESMTASEYYRSLQVDIDAQS